MHSHRVPTESGIRLDTKGSAPATSPTSGESGMKAAGFIA